MSTHANMVKMTVTSVASAGVGTITLNAASSGYQSLGTAYGADATVDILITEGTAWEVARACTYTHSGTTVTRGTLESSSTGSAVSFTSAAVVSVVASADSGRRWDSAALEHVAGGDADTTMAVGMMYVTPMSAWATADRTYTLPATAPVGSRIGIMVTSGNASYELIIKPGASDTINGGTAAAEWSRLFITGEVVILRCVTADSAWVVEYDGRIPCMLETNLNTTITTNTAGAAKQLTFTDSGGVSPDAQRGDCYTAASDKFTVRRAGYYATVVQSKPASGISDGQWYVSGLANVAMTTVYHQAFNYSAKASGYLMVPSARMQYYAVGAEMVGYFASEAANLGARGVTEPQSTYISIHEVL